MRIIVFLLSLISLIYIPTKLCVSIGCGLRNYEFFFNIPDRHQIDIERLVIQFLILGIVYIGTYSNFYKRIVLKIKKVEKKEKVFNKIISNKATEGISVIIFVILIFFLTGKLFNSGKDNVSKVLESIGEETLIELKKAESSNNSEKNKLSGGDTMNAYINAHNEALDKGEKTFEFGGRKYTVGTVKMQNF